MPKARHVFAAIALLGCVGAVTAGFVVAAVGDDRGITAVSAVLFAIGVLGWAVSKPPFESSFDTRKYRWPPGR